MNKRKYILVAIILILLVLLGIIIFTYYLNNNENTNDLSLKNIVKFNETIINNVVVDIDREETENDEKTNAENKEETNIKSNSNTEKQKVEEKDVNQSSTEKEKNSNSSVAKQKETNNSYKTNTETENIPTNKKEQNTVAKNETVSNKETSQNKNENKSTETETKKEEIIGNPDLANTHFTKYSKTKTQHAVDYINSKIKEDELYEKLGGRAIVVTEKPTDFWFSYTGDFKLDGVCLAGLIVKVYVEEEYVYDSKGINSYLYDTKAYIYQTQE